MNAQRRRNIALVAHDHKKDALIEWARINKETLAQHDLVATGTTGKLPKDKRTRAGLTAEAVEDIGETGKRSGKGSGGGSGKDRNKERGKDGARDRGKDRGKDRAKDRSKDRDADSGSSKKASTRTRQRTRRGAPVSGE